MLKRGSIHTFLFICIIFAALSMITLIVISYQRLPSSTDQCLTLGDALSVVDSKYSCYDTVGGQSALSLLFKRQVEGVQVTFIDPEGRRQVKIVKGASSQDVRGLNGAYNEPVSYSSDTIETFVYGGGAASSVEVAPVVNGQVCGVSDSRVLQPCSPEAVSSLALGENSANQNTEESHLECSGNTCTRFSGKGVNTCGVENTFCGSRGGGGGGGGGGGSSGSGGGSPGNQVPIAYFTTNVTSGAVPLSVLFNATLSTDPDGSIVSYSWNFGDGNITIASTSTIIHTYALSGLYTVVLTITDNSGATDTDSHDIDASNSGTTSTCGNNAIDAGEACDGANLNGNSCTTLGQGFTGGSLSCIASGQVNECQFNTGSCVTVAVCGNGLVQSGEACDDSNTNDGDGCSSSCTIESGYYCSGQPSTCAPVGSCADGLDNNNDGLIDWVGGDLDCANPGDSESNTPSGNLKNNWTVYHPAVDSRIVYVSQSTGNDANDGLSMNTPKKTIAAGTVLLRDGFPDWLLLKRGDVWNEALGYWSTSGRSDTERQVVSSYGALSDRPVLTLPVLDGASFGRANVGNAYVSNLSILGISLRPRADFGGFGTSFGVFILGPMSNLLFEGNSIQGFQSQFAAQSDAVLPIRNLVLRRNVLADTLNLEDLQGHSQGIIAGYVYNLTIEENIMDNNGVAGPIPFPDMSADYPDQSLANWTSVSAGKFDLLFVRYNSSTQENEYLRVPVSGVNLVGANSFAQVASRLQIASNSFAQPTNTINIQSYVYPYNNLNYFLFNNTDNLNIPSYSWGMYGFGPYTGAVSGGKDLVELDYSLPSLFNSCRNVAYTNRTNCGSTMQRNVFSQNMYITVGNKDVTVRGNIVSRAGHNGLQLRCGGVTENNLFIQNPLAMFSGGVSPFTITRNNVVLEGIDLASAQWGARAVGIDTQESGNATVENNIVAHTNSAWPYGSAYTVSGVGEGATNLNYRALIKNNIAYNWRGTSIGLNFGNASNTSVYDSVLINITNNAFQEPISGYLGYANPYTLENLTALRLSGNTYYSANSPGNWFGIYGYNSDYSTWLASSGEVGSQVQQVTYVDPNRTVESYNALQDKAATYDAFMEEARKQSRTAWRDEYSAAAVNQYIRDGFQIGGGRPGDCGDVGCSPTSSNSNLNFFHRLWKTLFTSEKLNGNVVVFENLTYSSQGWSNLVGHVVAPFSSNGQITLASLVSMVLLFILIAMAVIGLVLHRFKLI